MFQKAVFTIMTACHNSQHPFNYSPILAINLIQGTDQYYKSLIRYYFLIPMPHGISGIKRFMKIYYKDP